VSGRAGQELLLLGQPDLLVRVLEGGPVELVDLEPQEVELAGPRPLVAAEGGQRGVDVGELGLGRDERREVDTAEAVEGGPLGRRRQQRLVGVLAVEIDEGGASLGQRRHRREPAVDVGPGAALGRHDASQHDLLTAGVDEAPFDPGLGGPGADDARVGPPADEQVDGRHDERLAGAGLAGEGGGAGRQHERQVGDDAEVGDGELDEH
jgi:hypothetical protein